MTLRFYAAIWILQGLDVLLTWRFLDMGLAEGNPLGRIVIELGWSAVVAFKVLVTALFWGAWAYLRQFGTAWRRGEVAACVAVVVILAGAAVWNVWNMILVAKSGAVP